MRAWIADTPQRIPPLLRFKVHTGDDNISDIPLVLLARQAWEIMKRMKRGKMEEERNAINVVASYIHEVILYYECKTSIEILKF